MDKKSREDLPWVMKTRNLEKKSTFSNEDKESSMTALSIVDTRNQLKSALGNGYFKSRWSALIIVDPESGKSLPWELWKRNPAKVCLGYSDKKSN